jgi:hypothetical protein
MRPTRLSNSAKVGSLSSSSSSFSLGGGCGSRMSKLSYLKEGVNVYLDLTRFVT